MSHSIQLAYKQTDFDKMMKEFKDDGNKYYIEAVDGATTKLLWLSLGLGLAGATSVVILGNGAIRLGLRPLTRVEQTAQQITDGALGLSLPVTDPDTEVGRLAVALHTMLDRLRTALRRAEDSSGSCGTSSQTRATNCGPRSPPSRASPNRC
ncbi:hypothetical protein GCM10020254_81760 [Streptomyces goshikiensis]